LTKNLQSISAENRIGLKLMTTLIDIDNLANLL